MKQVLEFGLSYSSHMCRLRMDSTFILLQRRHPFPNSTVPVPLATTTAMMSITVLSSGDFGSEKSCASGPPVRRAGRIICPLSVSASIVRQKMWAYFGYLKCYGFKVIFSEINPVKKLRFSLRYHERSCCYEVVWAREHQW
ncbi:hypothetical protein E2C01_000122 [Portunus trituberculatus]|uniref:Uncharacterized protein n=1 Tax=Portunus trituberculatus TaxID=210409 RepID=A0A5B7CE96_PORTR|nr:hypothetical protein [Portunus trituberculatus]